MPVDEVNDYVNLTKGTSIMKKSLPGLYKYMNTLVNN